MVVFWAGRLESPTYLLGDPDSSHAYLATVTTTGPGVTIAPSTPEGIVL
jgi:hypothetical protein